jgi:hypothetical protein
MRKRVLAVLTWCCAAFVASCGGSSTEPGEGGAEGDIDASEGELRMKVGDDEVTFSDEKSGTVPEGFPADVLVYKGTAVTMSLKQKDGFMLMLATTDAADTVAKSYREAMAAQGWSEEADMQVGGQTSLIYKKDERSASVTVGAADGKTVINLVVQNPPK